MHGKHLFGLGLRKPHYADFLDAAPVAVDFVEVISENFMVAGGRPLDVLRRVRERHQVALHGVSLSIGSADGVCLDYLRRLRELIDAIEPMFVSDHLSWSRIGSFNSHDLLPLPYTEEALARVCNSIRQIHLAGHSQGRELLIDTHDQPVPGSVWSLYAEALQRLGPVATMIERDDNVPPLATLLGELDVARGIAAEQARRVA